MKGPLLVMVMVVMVVMVLSCYWQLFPQDYVSIKGQGGPCGVAPAAHVRASVMIMGNMD